jgi:hypothetical protein
MKTILVILLAALTAFSQTEVNMKLTNANPFKLKEAFKLMDEEDGFYDEVISRSAPNGTIYVYDKGNKLCFKFDKDGNHLLTFGKEGNGPGEFSQFIGDFVASNERVIFKNFVSRVIMFFDSEGKFIKDVKDHDLFRSQPVVVGSTFEFHFPSNEFTKQVKVVLDKDGNLLSKVDNKGYEEGALEKAMQAGMNSDRVKENMNRPRSFMPFGSLFAQHYTGSYKIDIIGANHKVTKTLTYDYDRVKIKDLMDLVPRAQRKFVENAPAERKKMFMQMMSTAQKELGGYHPDIVDIIGSYKEYLFVRTVSDKNNELVLHVISSEGVLVQESKLKCDEITSARVTHGMLLVNQTNDEDGPYTSVYKL